MQFNTVWLPVLCCLSQTLLLFKDLSVAWVETNWKQVERGVHVTGSHTIFIFRRSLGYQRISGTHPSPPWAGWGWTILAWTGFLWEVPERSSPFSKLACCNISGLRAPFTVSLRLLDVLRLLPRWHWQQIEAHLDTMRNLQQPFSGVAQDLTTQRKVRVSEWSSSSSILSFVHGWFCGFLVLQFHVDFESFSCGCSRLICVYVVWRVLRFGVLRKNLRPSPVQNCA